MKPSVDKFGGGGGVLVGHGRNEGKGVKEEGGGSSFFHRAVSLWQDAAGRQLTSKIWVIGIFSI